MMEGVLPSVCYVMPGGGLSAPLTACVFSTCGCNISILCCNSRHV